MNGLEMIAGALHVLPETPERDENTEHPEPLNWRKEIQEIPGAFRGLGVFISVGITIGEWLISIGSRPSLHHPICTRNGCRSRQRSRHEICSFSFKFLDESFIQNSDARYI
jgi:hypothetical protein